MLVSICHFLDLKKTKNTYLLSRNEHIYWLLDLEGEVNVNICFKYDLIEFEK